MQQRARLYLCGGDSLPRCSSDAMSISDITAFSLARTYQIGPPPQFWKLLHHDDSRAAM